MPNNFKEELMKVLEFYYDPEFNYEVEHWDNGNYDDSFEYGVETGMNQLAEKLITFVGKFDNE